MAAYHEISGKFLRGSTHELARCRGGFGCLVPKLDALVPGTWDLLLRLLQISDASCC